jgi:flavorubredoxin
LLDNNRLNIISHYENNIFIRYYDPSSKIVCIESIDYKFSFRSGRTLRFIKTPYAHSAGSFVTFDEKNKILFSSDLFGCYGEDWNLLIKIRDICKECNIKEKCSIDNKNCNLYRMLDFHKRIMSSSKALRNAMDVIENLKINIIAPQHGSIIHKSDDIKFLIELFKKQKDIGIDRITNS